MDMVRIIHRTVCHINHIASPSFPSKGIHSVSVLTELEEVLLLLSLAMTLTTASCSTPALMLVRSTSNSVGTKAKPILRTGSHWKTEPPNPIQPKKPALPQEKRSSFLRRTGV